MTGVDISNGMLNEGRKAARAAGVSVEWVHADATRVTFDRKFDAALCLCEGAFGLLAGDDDPFEHDMQILRNVAAVLKPGAPFILGALNGLKKIRQFNNDDVKSGKFDPLNLIEVFDMEQNTPEGKKTFILPERGYIASELKLMLRLTGFEVEHVWGGTAGNWRRDVLDMDEYEIMLVARRAREKD